MDYSKTIIYKIEHIENESLVYIGHTTNWDNRKYNHKSRCNNEENKWNNLKLYQMIRENGGWEFFKMIEVEKYPCNDKREAEKRENETMKKLKSNMNTNKSYITEEEKREMVKEYKETNKEKNKEKHKEYRENNKDKIKEFNKLYYETNKEKVKKYRDKYKEKVKCDCGCEITKKSIQRHQSTKKHIDWMKNKI